MKMNEEPKILGLLCKWCSYAGADLAGTSRFSYPPNVRIVQVPCSGRIDPTFVLTALQAVPAMGWGEVVESNHPDVPAGGRYYGWFPMSRFVDVAVTPTTDGLRDEGAHRVAHAPVYRVFAATDRDRFHQPGIDAEDRHALLRGLFVTGFLAEDFFADNDWFGARRVLVLSASS